MSNLNLFIVLYKSTFSIKMRREDIQDRPIVNVYFCSHPEPPLITVKNVRHIILCLCTKMREQDNTPLAAHDRRVNLAFNYLKDSACTYRPVNHGDGEENASSSTPQPHPIGTALFLHETLIE